MCTNAIPYFQIRFQVRNHQCIQIQTFIQYILGIVIGIDVGGSTTKIVGINGEQIQSPMFITATDPVTSLFGAFGKYIYDNGIQLADVEQVMNIMSFQQQPR